MSPDWIISLHVWKHRSNGLQKHTRAKGPSKCRRQFATVGSHETDRISRILKLEAPKNKVYVLGETGMEQELESSCLGFMNFR